MAKDPASKCGDRSKIGYIERKAPMTVTIHLSTETARKLRDAAHRRGQTLEDYVQQIAIVSAENEIVSTVNQSAEEWIAEWRAWGASHATLPHAVDDSRESIYEGRGE